MREIVYTCTPEKMQNKCPPTGGGVYMLAPGVCVGACGSCGSARKLEGNHKESSEVSMRSV